MTDIVLFMILLNAKRFIVLLASVEGKEKQWHWEELHASIF
jgi:hypothetical protein